MSIEITRPGKSSLVVSSPVMPAAGTVGFGDSYRRLIDYSRLGAIVTNPVTLSPRQPAAGARVVPLEAGVLLHTGLPNPGLRAVVNQYRRLWDRLPTPVILHFAATDPRQLRRASQIIDAVDEIAAVELGLDDGIDLDSALDFAAAASSFEKPTLARLPFYEASALAPPLADTNIDALVICGAPRGTARDARSGKLVSGRIYGPTLKPVILRLVGRLRRELPDDLPLIGAGGIHSPADARDYLEAGAAAVQVDAATWVQPKILERIARDLGGWISTRHKDALLDEWNPDMSQTEAIQRRDAT